MHAKRVLVPVHGDACDDLALQVACDLTRKEKGKVYVLYVIEVQRELPLDVDLSSETSLVEEVLQNLERLGNKEYKGNVEAEILQAREAGPAVVLEAVERRVDAIVVGLSYKKRYGAFSLGHTVPHILKNAPCPVLVWRQGVEPNGSKQQS